MIEFIIDLLRRDVMKHVFVINPIAGFENSFYKLSKELEKYKDKYDISLHVTSSIKDATAYTKDFLSLYPNEEIRFYSCGGDGTLSEIVNGIANNDNASVTCYPCGSGNDFVKSVGGREKFLNLEELFTAKNHKIDLIKVNDTYCLNVTNVGLEARVCKVANSLKGKSKHPYTRGIINALFTGMRHKLKVTVDGEDINPQGNLLLCSFANGGYAGGKYNCAPKYLLDDGLMEVCLVKPVSVFTLLRLIKKYEKGLHIDDKRLEKILRYKRAETVIVSSDKPFDICIDGEIYTDTSFTLKTIKRAINFAIPK